MTRPVRIANCSGFLGDRLDAAREVVEGGPIDVLTGDYLAELTMLILWKARRKDPTAGYARTFLTQLEQVLGTCLDREIKIVVNAGGLNPAGLADQVHTLAARLGLAPKVAHVRGDDVIDVIDLMGPELSNLDTGEPLTGKPVTANAYEIADPAYANPDVVAHFDTAELEQQAPDRVRISGTKGSPPPPDLKVAVNIEGGYRNTMTLVLTGLDIEEKAAWATALLFDALGGKESFAEVDTRLIRFDHRDAATNEQATAHLRITVKDPDPGKVGRRFANATMELAVGGPAGFHTTTPPTAESAFGIYWPTLISATEVRHEVVLPDGQVRLIEHHPAPRPLPSSVDAEPAPPADFGATARVPLGSVVGARSGDKGGNANLGVWVRDAAAYHWLDAYLTVDRLRELIPEAAGLVVRRFALPNVRALNFVLVGLLDQGVAATARPDPQAKGLGEYLRSRYADVPVTLLA